jgi:hypothetical protein
MTQQILLREELTPDEANIVESISDGKDYYLNGTMMVAEVKNGNGRIYQLDEMVQVVEKAMNQIKTGGPIMGQLNHPADLQINPYEVSHCITEMKMDGTNVVGKMKLLNTPAGNIVRGILEGGVRLGVSSRGTGSVGNDGRVSGFNFLTVDVVSTPSGPGCYPNLVRESLENQKILTLAEMVVEDKSAQRHLEKEIKKFLLSIVTKK